VNRWVVWSIAILAVLALGSWWRLKHRSSEAPRFRTAAVERGPIAATVSATGTVQPVEQVEVGSQVSGTVQKLFADYNSRVTEGQILLVLEPSAFKARVAQAEAAVAHADAAVTDGERQLKRARELRDQNVISDVELEAAEVAVDQRKADLKSARAQLESARVDLDHATIRSPIDGVVISRSIDVGQTVAASLQAPKLFVIAKNLEQMQVETSIDEADIGRIHIGLPVSFSVDAYPDMSFQGQVAQVRLEPITQSGVVTYTTVIATQNPGQRLRPGMTANVSVIAARRDDALKVPNAALRFRPTAPATARGGGGNRPLAAGGADAGSAGGGAMGQRGAGAGGAGAGGAGRGGPSQWSGAHRGAAGGGAWAGRGAPSESAAAGVAVDPLSVLKPGTIYALRGGQAVPVSLLAGITDGAMTEVVSNDLKTDDRVIVGYDLATKGPAQNLQAPPGLGGPQFRGPGAARGRGTTR
jgi:HlyD family secretion protein